MAPSVASKAMFCRLICPPKNALKPGLTANAQPERRAQDCRALGAPVVFIVVQVEPVRYAPSLCSARPSLPPQTKKCDPSQTPKPSQRPVRLLFSVVHLS